MKTRQIRSLILMLTFALVVRGQDNSTLKQLPVEAREPFRKGLLAVEQKEWPLAIRYFTEAQEKANYAPEVLFNLGLAESKMPGRELRAMAWFRAYLAAAPDSPNAQAVRNECDSMEIRIEGTLTRLIDQAKSMANAYSEDYRKRSALQEVVRMMAEAGDIEGAKRMVSSLPSDDQGSAYGTIALSQIKAGKPADARSTAYQVSDNSHSALSDIANGLADAGDISGAKSIISRINDTTYNPSACAHVAAVQAKAGDIEGAKETLGGAKGDYSLYSGLIAIGLAQAKAGKMDEARRTLVQAREAVSKRKNEEKYKVSEYHDVGKAQAEIGDAEGAKETTSFLVGDYKAQYQGYVFDAIRSYWENRCNEAIKKGDFKAAADAISQISGSERQQQVQEQLNRRLREIVQEKIKAGDLHGALATAEVMGDSNSRSYAYSDLATARLNKQEVDGAAKMIEHVTEPEAKASLSIRIAKEFLRKNDKPSAEKYLAMSRTAAESLTGYQRKYAVIGVAVQQIKMGNLQGGKETAGLLVSTRDDSNPADGLEVIARALAEGGDIAGALELAERIVYKENTYKNRALGYIAREQAKKGDTESALQTVAKIEDAKVRDGIYKDISVGQSDVGNFGVARKIADLIATDTIRADAYINFIGDLNSVDRGSDADEVAARVQSILDGVQDPKAKTEGYCKLSNWLKTDTTGTVALARALLEKACSVAPTIKDPSERGTRYVGSYSIGEMQRKAGLIAEARKSRWLALEAINELDDSKWEKRRTYREVSGFLAEIGDFAGAKEVANRIADGDYRDDALCKIASQFVRYRNFKQATATVNVVQSLDKKEAVLAEIAIQQANLGDLAAARQTAGLITTNQSAKTRACGALIVGHLKANDRESAKRLAQESANLDFSAETALLSAGEVAWAQERLSRLKEDYQRNSLLSRIGVAQAKAKDIEGAKKTVSLITDDGYSYKYSVCKALTEAGEIAWVTEFAPGIRDAYYWFEIQRDIAEAQLKKGDKEGALKTAGSLKGKWTRLWQRQRYALILAQAGDAEEAKAALATVSGKGFSFDGWFAYQTALSETNYTARAQKGAGIADKYWKSKLYASMPYAAFDHPSMRDWLKAISDPMEQSVTSLNVVERLVGADKLAQAAEVADLIPDENFKVTAISALAAAAIAKENVSGILPRVLSLPDGAAKTHILINILQSSAGSYERPAVVAAAVKSAEAIKGNLWKAMATADIARAAVPAGEAKGAEEVRQTIQALGATLAQSDQPLWTVYQTVRIGKPVEIPSKQEAQRQAQVSQATRDRVGQWTYLLKYTLNDQKYTDLQAYLQSLQTKTDPNEIFRGVSGTGLAITEKLREIKKMVVNQAKPAKTKSDY